MDLAIRWRGATETGRVRRRNEDAWGAFELSDPPGGSLLAVADGMGGHPGGDHASRIAIEACRQEAGRSADSLAGPDRLVRLFHDARARLRREADVLPSLDGMGTTLTVLLHQDDGAWVGHIGDSRLLWQRGAVLRLVTRDHNAAWEKVEAGEIDPEQAERDPLGSLLTRHLGTSGPSEPDLFASPLSLHPGDRLLLCSDGLGKAVPMEEAAAILQGQPLEAAVRRLLDRADRGGSPDLSLIHIS
ncbi:MAG: protein phosphatase 2C domain-containing protein, partial [Candidatus Eisenbacteria bacterium]|nr:protein phosphatase 2C domain-containing protein [Candidatus Eisenbacteria bacterium]